MTPDDGTIRELSAKLRRDWDLPDAGEIDLAAASTILRLLAEHVGQVDELLRKMLDTGRRAGGDDATSTLGDMTAVDAKAILRGVFAGGSDDVEQAVARQGRLLGAFVHALSHLDQDVRSHLTQHLRPETIEAATEQIGGVKASAIRGSRAFKAACWDRYCQVFDDAVRKPEDAPFAEIVRQFSRLPREMTQASGSAEARDDAS
ncbi:MAG: hypothetical protein AAGI46_10835 [Planctomycetota bacterium]